MNVTASLLDLRFFLLLATIALLRCVVPARWYLLFGIVSSSLVVALAAPLTFLTLTSIAFGVLFPLHRLSVAARSRRGAGWISRLVVPVGVVLLVTLFTVSKLHRNFTLPWFETSRLGMDIASLVGFSYFLFRAISYLHIQSILRLDEKTPWPLLFYVLFPATLTSGPIQKYQDFRQQLTHPLTLDPPLLYTAAYRITRGYFRKLVVAFLLNMWVTHLLAQPPNMFGSILTIVVLYLYFYFDFAGYSDIAIGLGLMMGIKVPENFRKPFAATTISEFWRNWHITLVDWFRDHVFIPLGGMRSSRTRAGFLALVIMVLCGLWHGPTAAFVGWGLWHGTAMLIEAISGTRPVPPDQRHGLTYWSRVGWTNLRVAIPCILFLPNPADISRLLHGLVIWPHL